MLPVVIKELIGTKRGDARSHGRQLVKVGEIDKSERHAFNDTEEWSIELKAADGRVRIQLTRSGVGQVGDGSTVLADIVRNGCLDMTRCRLDKGDWAGLCNEGINTLGAEEDGGADSGMPRKRELGVGYEDVDDALLVRFGIGDIVDKDGLGKVEFAGDGLFLVLGRRGNTGGDCHDGEGVAAIAGGGEDVEGNEGELHIRFSISVELRKVYSGRGVRATRCTMA